jgi:hypothetical protein
VGEGFEKEENLRIKALNHDVIGDCEGERERERGLGLGLGLGVIEKERV